MALIPCPECGRILSDKAVTCPDCGFPIREYQTDNSGALAPGTDKQASSQGSPVPSRPATIPATPPAAGKQDAGQGKVASEVRSSKTETPPLLKPASPKPLRLWRHSLMMRTLLILFACFLLIMALEYLRDAFKMDITIHSVDIPIPGPISGMHSTSHSLVSKYSPRGSAFFLTAMMLLVSVALLLNRAWERRAQGGPLDRLWERTTAANLMLCSLLTLLAVLMLRHRDWAWSSMWLLGLLFIAGVLPVHFPPSGKQLNRPWIRSTILIIVLTFFWFYQIRIGQMTYHTNPETAAAVFASAASAETPLTNSGDILFMQTPDHKTLFTKITPDLVRALDKHKVAINQYQENEHEIPLPGWLPFVFLGFFILRQAFLQIRRWSNPDQTPGSVQAEPRYLLPLFAVVNLYVAIWLAAANGMPAEWPFLLVLIVITGFFVIGSILWRMRAAANPDQKAGWVFLFFAFNLGLVAGVFALSLHSPGSPVLAWVLGYILLGAICCLVGLAGIPAFKKDEV